MSGAIPVALRLKTRGVNIDPRCQIYGEEGESIEHILFLCPLARQVWALSNLPSPVDGFFSHSLYHNIHYVLSLKKNLSIPLESRRMVPWILWLLWKNRNNLLFEGMVYLVKDMLDKIKASSDEWFHAQEIEIGEEKKEQDVLDGIKKLWRPPPKPWLKCNVAFSWDKEKKIGGSAWVLRNSEGIVLLHSRRAFGAIISRQEAEMVSYCWAVESMSSLKIPRVIFAIDGKDLVSAVSRPRAWPSFKGQVHQILLALSLVLNWRLEHEERNANLGAFLIARSVTLEDRSQSYVAQGYPFWLKDVFTNESCIT